MNSLNSLIVEGYMLHDSLTRTTSKGLKVTTFSIVNQWSYRQTGELKTEVSHFDVVAFNKIAERVSILGHKGRGVRVVGRLKELDGSISIVADHVEFRPEAETKKETE
jgi:single-strand DNA-binding protein